MEKIVHRWLAIVLCSLFVTATLAAAPAIRAAQAWARATAPGAPNGGVYLRIDNKGPADDRLLRASTAVAQNVDLHAHRMNGGVARMIAQPAILLPAGKVTEFAPGGLHVMLIGLLRPLREGERFTLTLEFEKAGRQQVEVTVRGLAATGPDAGSHH